MHTREGEHNCLIYWLHRATAKKWNTMRELHDFLYESHNAYSADRHNAIEAPVDAAVLASY